VESLRALRASLAGGASLRPALANWPQRAPAEARPHLARVARRVALGCDLGRAVAGAGFGEDGSALAAILTAAEAGADGAALLEGLAVSIERREQDRRRSRGAVSGALVSARVVAALPLVGLLGLPLSDGLLLDRAGLALLAAGVALDLLGAVWLAHLTPSPGPDDPVAGLAERLAAALSCGRSARQALALLARSDAALARPERLLRLGASWQRALAPLPDADGLGAIIERAERSGIPCAEALISFARLRRDRIEADRARALGRAPVLMMFPLTLCVLPAFLLVGVVPYLRSLAV
jgi:tight adherence protein B